MALTTEQALGELICKLNPYTGVPDPAGKKEQTGMMDIFVGNPDPTNNDANDYAQVELEEDTKYPGEWGFKGETQRINTAVRIKYRYPVKDVSGTVLYWRDNYLLIGYEGGGI